MALGGPSRETIVDAVSTADLEQFRTTVASKVDRLYSNFEVNGLVIFVGELSRAQQESGWRASGCR